MKHTSAAKPAFYTCRSHDTERYSALRRNTRIIRYAVCHLNLRLHEGYGESELTYGEIHNPPFFPRVTPLLSFVIL
jgi:hypothetical protein